MLQLNLNLLSHVAASLLEEIMLVTAYSGCTQHSKQAPGLRKVHLPAPQSSRRNLKTSNFIPQIPNPKSKSLKIPARPPQFIPETFTSPPP